MDNPLFAPRARHPHIFADKLRKVNKEEAIAKDAEKNPGHK